MLTGKQVGFLGAGAIAEALIRGMLEANVVQPEQILVSNRSNRERLEQLSRQYGVKAISGRRSLADQAQVLVLACKPKDVAELLAEVGERCRPGQILLSLAAGISTAFIAERITPGVEVVRAMPNTSCRVGESATAVCRGEGANDDSLALVTAILGSVGRVYQVPEGQMDAVTGLSGSGPAYIYLVTEAMVQAGQELGLSADVARQLSIQTLKGAAKMLEETGAEPYLLREQVTSPNGTTAAGLAVLNEAGFSQALVRAIARATERSQELGRAQSLAKTALG